MVYFLQIGVQIGKRVDLRAHLTVAIMWVAPSAVHEKANMISLRGCGPIGLITAAVAHAYSARKIISFDNNPLRVEFAKKYISPLTGKPIIDHVFLTTDLPETSLKPNSNGKKHDEKTSIVGDGEPVEVDDHEEETVGDMKFEHAKVRAAEYLEQIGLTGEEGVDRVVEATGSEDCGLLGVAIAKQGAICKRPSFL